VRVHVRRKRLVHLRDLGNIYPLFTIL
jgi:hypothetical protein